MSEPNVVLDGVPVTLDLSYGWVVSTPDSDGPYVIGPFENEAEGDAWRREMDPHLVENLTYHGGTLIFDPASYSTVSRLMREQGHPGPG
jgi:hypothetical protein